MPRDALDTVLRLRRVTVDEAKRSLAAGLRTEEQARSRAAAAEALVAQEGEAASDPALGDTAVEAFAAWLPVGRAQVDAACATHDEACSSVARHRAALSVAHAEAEAAESLLDRRRLKQTIAQAQRAQSVLDEMGARSLGAEDPA